MDDEWHCPWAVWAARVAPGGAPGMGGGERQNCPWRVHGNVLYEHAAAPWRGGPRVSARSHHRTKEAPEGEVGIGPRGALHHDGSLHQKAYTLGTHSARCDPQGSFTSTSARGDVPPAAAPASVLRRRLWAKGYTRSAAHAPTPGLVTPEPAQRAGGRAVWIEARMWGGFGGSATRVDQIHPDDVSRPAQKKEVKFTIFF